MGDQIPAAEASVDKRRAKSRRNRSISGKRKHRPLNRFEMEQEKASTSVSAKKLKAGEDIDVPISVDFGYRILNFVTVFSAISNVVKCKKCNGDVEFMESNIRGLGFKLVISCKSCEPTSVNSSPLINNKAYDINRRIIFAFQLLGIGLGGIEKFCGIMDFPKAVYRSFYNTVSENILTAAESVCKVSMENAVKEEQKLTTETEKSSGLTVSYDGTWYKQNYSSYYGASTIIGNYTGKVLDLVINFFHCEACEILSESVGATGYELQQENNGKECSVSHKESCEKIGVDGVVEIFSRSIRKYNVCYTNYLEDGDTKMYEEILNANPYEEKVMKKTCIGDVQKKKSLRPVIQSMALKNSFDDAEIVKIAIFVAASTFNDGYKSIMAIMNVLNLKIGNRCYEYCAKVDEQRLGW